jgi:hypothetical protein
VEDENIISLDLHGPSTLRIRIGDSSSGRFVLATAPQVEGLINHLASLRAQMQPEVSRTFDIGRLPQGEVDPIWALPSHPAAEDKFLLIRHRGIGWLSFLFRREVTQKLSDSLRPPERTPVSPDQSLQ